VAQAQAVLGGLAGQALVWAGDMVSGFVSGILNGVGAVGSAVAQIAGTIAAHLHFSKPDVGVLTESDTWMPDFTDLIAHGLTTGVPKLTAAMTEFTRPFALSLHPDVSAGGVRGGGSLPSGLSLVPQSVSTPTTIVVNMPRNDTYVDGYKLAGTLMPHIAAQVQNGMFTGGR